MTRERKAYCVEMGFLSRDGLQRGRGNILFLADGCVFGFLNMSHGSGILVGVQYADKTPKSISLACLSAERINLSGVPGYIKGTRIILHPSDNQNTIKGYLGIYMYDDLEDKQEAGYKIFRHYEKINSISEIGKISAKEIESLLDGKRRLFDGQQGNKLENVAFGNGQTCWMTFKL